MIVRSSALKQSGPFDPIFGSYYEDVDLCRRIRSAGYSVGICAGAWVRHFSGSSTRTEEARRRRMRQIVRNRAISRIRDAGPSRICAVVREFAGSFPWNLLRGVACTASSQPPAVQVGAHVDLCRIIGRLLSEARDKAAWEQYLAGIGWGGRSLPGTRPLELHVVGNGGAA
jgi:hypothetical protein